MQKQISKDKFYCLECGSEIKRKPYQIKDGIKLYCNRKCKIKAQTGRILGERIKREISHCLTCNSEIKRLPREIRDGTKLYCDRECFNKAPKIFKGKRVKRKIYHCFQCGKKILRLKCIAKQYNKIYCNKECYDKSKKGHIPWNKDKKYPEKLRKKLSIVQRNSFILHPERKERLIKMNLGKRYSKETNMKKGWNRGKKWVDVFGKKRYAEIAQKKRIGSIKAQKKLWANPKYVKWLFERLNYKPTQPELYLDAILQLNFPNEWKYVGDGNLLIERKNPDFVNCNGKKLIIEYNGFAFRSKRVGNIGHTKNKDEKKSKIFAKYGYKTLNLYPKDLDSEPALIRKIAEFTNS